MQSTKAQRAPTRAPRDPNDGLGGIVELERKLLEQLQPFLTDDGRIDVRAALAHPPFLAMQRGFATAAVRIAAQENSTTWSKVSEVAKAQLIALAVDGTASTVGVDPEYVNFLLGCVTPVKKTLSFLLWAAWEAGGEMGDTRILARPAVWRLVEASDWTVDLRGKAITYEYVTRDGKLVMVKIYHGQSASISAQWGKRGYDAFLEFIRKHDTRGAPDNTADRFPSYAEIRGNITRPVSHCIPAQQTGCAFHTLALKATAPGGPPDGVIPLLASTMPIVGARATETESAHLHIIEFMGALTDLAYTDAGISSACKAMTDLPLFVQQVPSRLPFSKQMLNGCSPLIRYYSVNPEFRIMRWLTVGAKHKALIHKGYARRRLFFTISGIPQISLALPRSFDAIDRDKGAIDVRFFAQVVPDANLFNPPITAPGECRPQLFLPPALQPTSTDSRGLLLFVSCVEYGMADYIVWVLLYFHADEAQNQSAATTLQHVRSIEFDLKQALAPIHNQLAWVQSDHAIGSSTTPFIEAIARAWLAGEDLSGSDEVDAEEAEAAARGIVEEDK